MATVVINDDLYRRLQARAEATGSSVEIDIGRALGGDDQADAAPRARRSSLLDLIDKTRENPIYRDGRVPDAVELIRQGRVEDEIDVMRAVRGER